uniref:Activating signal cointegrator 1 complex subunit 3 n=1 Tax=Maylandia zebra TaxID=106582 RepID=A0A3P9B0X6_9CICH
MLTINTHKGLFRFCRLPFGITSAPALFQRAIDQILSGLPGVQCYLDDILCTGADDEEHLRNLDATLQRLKEYGLRVRKEKCDFFQSSVEYLGHVIDANGLHTAPSKITAIVDAPPPRNVSQLKSFLGLLNYYGRFIPNLASLLKPLHNLLRKEEAWEWTASGQDAFQKAKDSLTASEVLTHFNPKFPIQLACDASPYGVGAVISHILPNGEERPIAFASRTLNTAESNYAQLEREALSIVFGVRKFHQYLYGRKFTLFTDHRPLTTILGPYTGIPSLAASRLQRWALILSGHSYDIKYRKSESHCNADGLSRLPLPVKKPVSDTVEILYFREVETAPVSAVQVKKASRNDPVLAAVLDWIIKGLPASKGVDLKAFLGKRVELSVQAGCLLWGRRVIIPMSLRPKLLKQLHAGHSGIVRMKEIARSYFWWPNMDKQIEEIAKNCSSCQMVRNNPPLIELSPHTNKVFLPDFSVLLRTNDELFPSDLSLKVSAEVTKPTYGCQVTIQSEQEKQMLKMYRREEKKERKRFKGGDEGDSTDALLTFDPREMRAQREQALLTARHEPVLSRDRVYERIRYPNVYDNLAEATKTAAFVGGARMLLPEGIRRENCKMYEEVEIPPNEPMPVGFEEKPVYISEIDEIGQLVFKGMKRLNRIQSIVFETAYNTNENLLICAPTGAGKTNIAMLTVLHEIRQHLQPGGVIKKDEFKIVYVAPMKALAAEMTNYFGKRLEPLGITVKELTGDMQLTKGEILRTQMLVTTPEKWDVVTRKSVGDVALSQIVRLLILDEVHLLHEDRGPVLESLVARTIRQVESTQSMIRILGLSATLPNYLDVATFLHVNPYIGLFFFDGRFRPVPLGQTFVGIKTNNKIQQIHDMEEVCYDKVLEQVKAGHQVMVFVHARNATVRTAMGLIEMAKNRGEICFFQPDQGSDYGQCEKQIQRSRNKQMKEMFPEGFGIHHAGMLRSDRSLMESMFSRGHLKVLVCTATLAWGVNLPAHAVIIKGTQIYDAKRGAVVDLGILDVMQIFGRAGRPQFDKYGEGTIITTHDKLSHYLTLLTQQNAIESRFLDSLADNLNAEIALGTVTNVEEAVKWLSYTYLYVRMRANPLVYGINHKASQMDPALELYRKDLVVESGRKLDKARMIRFDERTGYFASTDLGRTASHFYIKYNTIETFNEHFNPQGTEADILSIVSKAEEFEQLKVREEEMEELEQMLCSYCQLPAAGGVENGYGKVNILLQTYIGRGEVDSFSLISDLSYVAQNAARIVRALFEIALRKRWPLMTRRLLTLCKVIDKRLWDSAHPLRQFPNLSPVVLNRLEEKKLTVDKLKEMRKDDIGHMLHHVNIGLTVKQCVHQIPSISMEATIQPITRTVLRVRLIVTPDFRWNDQVHGSVGEPWWLWVEDAMNDHIYHSEYFLLQKKQVVSGEPQHIVFTIPIFEPLPSQYYIRAVSDRWLGAEAVCIINFQDLILPERHPPHTELLDLQPLPVTALGNREYESLYKFTHFNPIQTQIFHTLYHTDTNVLLGAPTGSGKTIAAEMAMFRVFNKYPSSKVVYIAPLKALVRERIEDWKVRIEEKLGKNVVELTGDVTPDMRAIAKADLIVTTPEKWDGVSRSWQNRSYVQKVAILIIDEIHLLGEDRGPVLEVIVSRTNFISSHTSKSVRVVGLSTALANARDLADWLGIGQVGLFNFRPSVRPVPLEVHIHGFPGQHYCPRMASMNKPTFQAIRAHSPAKPVLIFVSSRRQTRLTALDLIAYLATEDNPKQWLHQDEREIEDIIGTVRDSNLKLTLAFGIGMHHAGLHERDRKTVEELFVNCKIQVLIATSTLAWGVNFPAHLVVVKGTEYYDGKSRRYVDYPITDVLQMMGRAGRPQFDDQGKAVILVHDIKKDFYKKFLYEPFPVESSLLGVLSDHLNAEIAAGTISSKQDAMDYITWTYFFRRLMMNPSYYSLEDISHESINRYLSNLVERSLRDLEGSYCIEIKEDDQSTEPLTYGRIASYYYLKHQTIRTFKERLRAELPIHELLSVLTVSFICSQVIPARISVILLFEQSISCLHLPRIHLLIEHKPPRYKPGEGTGLSASSTISTAVRKRSNSVCRHTKVSRLRLRAAINSGRGRRQRFQRL